jgi:hypothetical protein
MINYIYTKSPLDINRLTQEIRSSAITIALDHIDYFSDQATIWFKLEISLEEKDILDSIVSNHTGEPLLDDYIQHISGEVTPTTPKNEHELKSAGMSKIRFDFSDYACAATLTNKNGQQFTINSSLDVEEGDFICQDFFQKRARIAAVNSGVITVEGNLENGSCFHSRPVNLDYCIPYPDKGEYYWLWGLFFDSDNFGDDDFAISQVVDIDNILGYGNEVVLKEYDSSWVRHINIENKITTPDGSPGQIIPGLYVRIKYYPSISTGVNNVWVDHILTEKD